jgi:hypothetical protein
LLNRANEKIRLGRLRILRGRVGAQIRHRGFVRWLRHILWLKCAVGAMGCHIMHNHTLVEWAPALLALHAFVVFSGSNNLHQGGLHIRERPAHHFQPFVWGIQSSGAQNRLAHCWETIQSLK